MSNFIRNYSDYLGSKRCCNVNNGKDIVVKGDTGAPGPIGPRGFTGIDGATGPYGFTGPQGATGLEGPTGPSGGGGLPNTLQQVLTTGNVAQAPLTAVIQDSTLSTSTTIRGNAIEIEIDDGINPLQIASLTYNSLSHQGNAVGNNFTIQTDENLILTSEDLFILANDDLLITSDNLSMSASTLGLTSDSVGYTTNPSLLITNTNATAGNTTGVPSIELTKTGRNGAVNDVIGSLFFNALDGAGVERTFGKIESTITTTTAPLNHDGALDFYSLINGANQLVFRLNGADNENNSFRPLDLNGNVLRTSAGNLDITSTASAGTGDITIAPKRDLIFTTTGLNGDISGTTTDGNITMTANGIGGSTNGAVFLTADRAVGFASAQGGSDGNIILDVNSIGDLQLEGTTLISPSSSGNSGQHLRIKLNGTYYKIQLLND